MAARKHNLNIGRDVLRRLVADNYPPIARSLLQPLLHLLSTSREACGGDVDKFLIMLVIAIRTTEHEGFATYSQAQLLSGEIPIFPTLGTNVRSVADSTGTPKETVRRKVGELVKAARRRGLGTGDFRLRRIDCGGEILSSALAEAARETLGAPSPTRSR